MGITQKEVSEAHDKSVDNRLPVGGWPVYREYRLWHRGEGIERFYHVSAASSPQWREVAVPEGTGAHEAGYRTELEPDWTGVEVYSPLRVPGLFLEFATLFHGPMKLEEAARVVRDFVRVYGALGVHTLYPTQDGRWIEGRLDTSQPVDKFWQRSVEAGWCLRLYEAVNRPQGPDVDRLRAMGMGNGTPKQLVDRAEAQYLDTLNMHLESETFTRMYRHRDGGKPFRGPGFHSLLGALWLQFAALVEAREEEIKRCRWCGDIIHFKPGALPDDAPKGARRKGGTTAKREFCPSKRGIENKCKNDFNYWTKKQAR